MFQAQLSCGGRSARGGMIGPRGALRMVIRYHAVFMRRRSAGARDAFDDYFVLHAPRSALCRTCSIPACGDQGAALTTESIPLGSVKPPPRGRLLRVLGTVFAVAVGIGTTMGGGILYVPGKIAALLPNTWLYM